MIKRRDVLKLFPAMAAASLSSQSDMHAQSQNVRTRKVGLNLAPVTYYTTEHPFRNLALSASRWRLQEIGGPFLWDLPLPPSTPTGYPLTVPAGYYLESFIVFTEHRAHLPELITVTYEGLGTLQYVGGGQLVSRAAGRDVVRNLRNDSPITMRLVSTSASQPLQNIRVIEGLTPSTAHFRVPFLTRLSSMSVLRFMDWMDTNNSKTSTWAQRPRLNRYSQTEGGVALELMVALCNQLRVSPWFTLPHLANDDYIRRFAELVRSSLHSDLAVHVEYSNEVWNGLFEQSAYARREGLRLGLSTNEYEAGLRFYSQRTSEMLSIWEDVFGSQKGRVIGVYAAHAVNTWTSEVILSWRDAAEHADVLAIAPYFGPSFGNAENGPAVARWSLDQLFTALEREVNGENRVFIQRQTAIARRFGIRLVAYEGGQHLVAATGTTHDQALQRLFSAANRHQRMGDLYQTHLSHWFLEGGDVYALFNSMGTYSQWGYWGLLEHESGAATAAKWRALQELRTPHRAVQGGPTGAHEAPKTKKENPPPKR